MALFDSLDPNQILAQRRAQQQALIQGSPREERLGTALGVGLGEFGKALAQKSGVFGDIDPEMTQAQETQRILEDTQQGDFDLNSPEDLKGLARKFRGVGNLNQAAKLLQRADQLRAGEKAGVRDDLELRKLKAEVELAESPASVLPKDTRTTLQKNLEAAGFKPGTPEYMAAVKDAVSKKGTNVTINQTEGQRKDEFMATQITDAIGSIQNTLGTGSFDPTTVDKKVIDVFGSWANFAKSPEWQAFEGDNELAVEMFLNKTTGAAYTPMQKEAAERRLKINPGDNPKTIKLKLDRLNKLRNDLRESAGLDPVIDAPAPTSGRFEGFSIVR